jgi:hypothetical protein
LTRAARHDRSTVATVSGRESSRFPGTNPTDGSVVGDAVAKRPTTRTGR